MSIDHVLDDHDALGQAELLRRKEISAKELVEAAVARIEHRNLQVNAVVETMYGQARERLERAGDTPPAGVFGGVPFLLKDLIETVAGVPTQSGSRFWRGWVPSHDSELYGRFCEAGLVTLGKTSCPELGIQPVTEPSAFGPTRNPWNLERTCGGSSGGSAAAVAARMVPIASGGDGGGSIRIPSSCCGLFGLKPTRARTPIGPDASEGWGGFACQHVLTRTVRDSAAALDATAGPEPTSPYYAPPVLGSFLDATTRDPRTLRIAYHVEPAMPSEVHADCVTAVDDAVALLTELGHRVEPVHPQHDADALGMAFVSVVAANIAADIVEGGRVRARKARFDDYEVETWLLSIAGRALTAGELALAIRTLQTEARRLVAFYDGYDAILTPTLARPPLEIGELRPSGAEARAFRAMARARLTAPLRHFGLEEMARRAFRFTPFTPVANFTGQPSMSVPLFWNSDNLPIGVMFTGRFGDEATLFALAAQLERARPWADRRPPLFT